VFPLNCSIARPGTGRGKDETRSKFGKVQQNKKIAMKSRKSRAAATASDETRPVVPKTEQRTVIAEITGCAIRLTAIRAQAHKKCGRRECRIGKICTAEGLGSDGMPPCAAHWDEHDHSFFFGAFTFGALNLCPRLPEGVDPQDALWKEGEEDNPYDLVPVISFVHRSLTEEY
jgi:hypothetical protein